MTDTPIPLDSDVHRSVTAYARGAADRLTANQWATTIMTPGDGTPYRVYLIWPDPGLLEVHVAASYTNAHDPMSGITIEQVRMGLTTHILGLHGNPHVAAVYDLFLRTLFDRLEDLA